MSRIFSLVLLRFPLTLLLGVGLALVAIAGWAQTAQGFLEPKGTLVIVGGGDTPPDVDRRFVQLAGGPGKARIALLPMALRNNDEEAREVTADLERLGAKVELVNMSARGARFASTAKRLEKFTGFWFLGGDQSRLSGILVDSPALDAIVRRYQEGAVIGGTSAGAAVMSGVMLTGRYRVEQPPGDVEMFNIGRGMKEVTKGFDFIKGAIIDQHFDTRARYNRLLSAVLDHPQLLGVGIDEQTALIVRPDGIWEVQGKYYVKIFDARFARVVDDEGPMARASDIRMHVLPAGSTFDVERNKVRFLGD